MKTRTVLCGGTLLLMTVFLAGCLRQGQQPPPPSPPQVTVTRAVTSQILDYEEFTGHSQAVNSITVTSMVTGYLDKVLFTEGAVVQEDQALFQIDPRIFQAQRDQAEANVVLAKAHLNRLEADFRRARALLPTKAISQEEFDKAAGDRDEAAATVGMVENALKTAKQNLEYTTVRAKFAGRVSRQMVDPGSMVKANETGLTTLVTNGKMYVWFDVDERTAIRIRKLIEAGKISGADQSTIAINYGLADEEGFPYEAKVNFEDNQLDAATGTWRLRALIEKPAAALLPNMFVRVRVPIGKAYETLLVPERALGTDQGQKYLYVIDDENKAIYTQVTCGPLREGMRAILSGLKPKDRFVVNGLQRVRPGAAVDPRDEKAKKEEAKKEVAER
jgi:RND family efflux transporter MFP subunit